MKQSKINKRFIYLISPNKIKNRSFYIDLEKILKLKKVSFFQLRLKKETIKNKTFIGKKIKKICTKYRVKFLINDEPLLAKKLKADGCHIGQKDMSFFNSRKILMNKKILYSGANYVACSSSVWNNKKLDPVYAIKEFK